MRYLPLEKLAMALGITTRKFMHYFQAYLIEVYTEFPLKNMLMKADLLGILSTWVVEFEQFDIKFLPRAAINGRVLADFVAKFSPRTVSPKPGYLASTHKEEESSA